MCNVFRRSASSSAVDATCSAAATSALWRAETSSSILVALFEIKDQFSATVVLRKGVKF